MSYFDTVTLNHLKFCNFIMLAQSLLSTDYQVGVRLGSFPSDSRYPDTEVSFGDKTDETKAHID